MPRTRSVREAVVILGRSTVEQALSRRGDVAAYLASHPSEVRQAIAGIRGHLPHDIAGAAAYAANLPNDLRTAIAGGWVDGAGLRALATLGLEERT